MEFIKQIIDLWVNAQIYRPTKRNNKALRQRIQWLEQHDNWQDEYR